MILDYVIPEQNITLLMDQIVKANKTARKLNLEEITVIEGDIEYRQLYVCPKGRETSVDQGAYWINEDSFEDNKLVKLGPVRNWINVTIKGEQPKFSGWTFAATLMPVPTDQGIENQIRKVPGVDFDIPKEYRSRAGECDHCKKNRRRNETYVVRDDNGVFKMVGSSCLKDFLGHADPYAIADYLSRILQFKSVCECIDDGWHTDSEVQTYLAKSILAQTIGVIRKFGWLSKKKVWEQQYGIATASRVIAFMQPPHRLSPEERQQQKKVMPTADDHKKANDIFDWLGTIDTNTDNEYLYNLSLLSRSEFVTYKSIGLICSAVVAYDRELAKKERAKDYKDSKHVGKVKERTEFYVTVQRIFEKEGDFGLTRIHHMLTDDGNYLVWFASSYGLDEGFSGLIKATIKKHDEFNGVKQTVVNRVTKVQPKVKA